MRQSYLLHPRVETIFSLEKCQELKFKQRFQFLGKEQIIRTLIDYGASMNATSSNEDTTLMLALPTGMSQL